MSEEGLTSSSSSEIRQERRLLSLSFRFELSFLMTRLLDTIDGWHACALTKNQKPFRVRVGRQFPYVYSVVCRPTYRWNDLWIFCSVLIAMPQKVRLVYIVLRVPKGSVHQQWEPWLWSFCQKKRLPEVRTPGVHMVFADVSQPWPSLSPA